MKVFEGAESALIENDRKLNNESIIEMRIYSRDINALK